MFSIKSRASISVGFRKAASIHKTQSSLWTESTWGKQQQQQIHPGNQQLVLNQNMNVNTGYSILIFKMPFQIPGKIIPISEFAWFSAICRTVSWNIKTSIWPQPLHYIAVCRWSTRPPLALELHRCFFCLFVTLLPANKTEGWCRLFLEENARIMKIQTKLYGKEY